MLARSLPQHTSSLRTSLSLSATLTHHTYLSLKYYEGGISSVYMWEDDNEDGSKTGQGRRGYLEEGAWDAIHVIEISMKLSVADGHLCNMGRMIEEMESKLRNSLDQVIVSKE
ncbi:putative F-actin-capping protein subunit beta [Glycine soja]